MSGAESVYNQEMEQTLSNSDYVRFIVLPQYPSEDFYFTVSLWIPATEICNVI